MWLLWEESKNNFRKKLDNCCARNYSIEEVRSFSELRMLDAANNLRTDAGGSSMSVLLSSSRYCFFFSYFFGL
jgi:hypothetical protein